MVRRGGGAREDEKPRGEVRGRRQSARGVGCVRSSVERARTRIAAGRRAAGERGIGAGVFAAFVDPTPRRDRTMDAPSRGCLCGRCTGSCYTCDGRSGVARAGVVAGRFISRVVTKGRVVPRRGRRRGQRRLESRVRRAPRLGSIRRQRSSRSRERSWRHTTSQTETTTRRTLGRSLCRGACGGAGKAQDGRPERKGSLASHPAGIPFPPTPFRSIRFISIDPSRARPRETDAAGARAERTGSR